HSLGYSIHKHQFASPSEAFRQTQPTPLVLGHRPAVCPPVRLVVSALHCEAGHVLFLEAIAHGRRIIAVTEADEAGAVELLAVLLERFDIGAEVTQTTDLASGIGQHRPRACFGRACADLDDPATNRSSISHR